MPFARAKGLSVKLSIVIAGVCFALVIFEIRDIYNIFRDQELAAAKTKIVIQTTASDLDKQIDYLESAINSISWQVYGEKASILTIAQQALSEELPDKVRRSLENIISKSEEASIKMTQLSDSFVNLMQRIHVKIVDLESAPHASEGKFGLAFWIGIVGIVGAISTILLAWRKDHREAQELRLKLKQAKATA